MAVDTLRRVASYSPLDNCMLKVHTGGAVKLISYTTVTFMYHSMNCVWCKLYSDHNCLLKTNNA